MPGIKGLVAVALATALIGCGNLGLGGGGDSIWSNPGQQSHGDPVRDHVSFVDALRGQGVTVRILSEAEQDFLKPKGTRLGLTGGPLSQPAEIQSYGYETEVDAQADSEHITPDGQTRTTMITWVDDPHFFRRERVIVLYVGKDPAVLQLLMYFLGTQFAGQ